jgi:hypothetical protein
LLRFALKPVGGARHWDRVPLIATSSSLLLALQLLAPPPPPPSPGDDLAAEAPEMDWVPEGGADATTGDTDPRVKQRKIRRAAITSVTGGAIVIVGAAGIIAGSMMIYLPRAKLEKQRSESGSLPPGDEARQRAIATWQAGPIVLGVGAGLAVVGVVMTAIGATKVRRLREERRKTVAFSPSFVPGGVGLSAQGRF